MQLKWVVAGTLAVVCVTAQGQTDLGVQRGPGAGEKVDV